MQLALESSTKVCSVAFQNAEGEVFEKRTEVKGSHSEELFLFIEQLTEEHGFRLPDLSAVIVSAGPGSYTGLRISASAVKGLLFGTDVPLLAADTLASFAAAAVQEQPDLKTIHPVIDARRVHLYHRQFSYDSGKLSAAGEVSIIPIEEFQKKLKAGDGVIGTGLHRVDAKAFEGVRLLMRAASPPLRCLSWRRWRAPGSL